MKVFKCKMCGGTLEINNETTTTCEYCGTQQTLPKLDDERKQNLYDRASHFRRNNEFDKAMGIYEQILNEDQSDAEAYWSLVLCQYGIEYVENPATHKRVPTVNRAQFTSVFEDENYKSALKHADTYQKVIYETEAKAINEIQKGILEISQKEEPFDVFICYKESDNNGRRTPDSVLANDLYHQLTQEGFKVFFSRITLEDKLGSAYEPYIFAALNSAKVMVVLGTSPEYFNAVWVKNEWSRYLSLIKQGQKKMLIPAYKDMDPYDLPEEFSHLQAQDMSKLGFMQDLIRGIKKIIQVDEQPQVVVPEIATINMGVNVDSLLKRAFMFLEDGEWESAEEYCEKVLDLDPENAQAYLGKLMSELKVSKRENLKDCLESFEERNNYQKILRFANDELKNILVEYIEDINTRNERKRLEEIYGQGQKIMEKGGTAFEYKKAASLFEEIIDYKNARVLAEECHRLAEIERKETKRINKKNKKIVAAIAISVIAMAILAFILRIVIIPNAKYKKALELMDNGEYIEAINSFSELGSYKESEALILECELEIEYEAAMKLLSQGDFTQAYISFQKLGEYRDSTENAKIAQNKMINAANVGDIIKLGTYEQDNDLSNGQEEIEWIVLEIKDGKLLVISKYALDVRPYDELVSSDRTATNIWRDCSLRKWLNSDFLKTSFADYEKDIIPTMVVSNAENGDEIDTQDKLFLLSLFEVKTYFESEEKRRCAATRYVLEKADTNASHSNCDIDWWLRTPATENQFGWKDVMAVMESGSINEGGSSPHYDALIAVRPAMWISNVSEE